MENGDVQGSGNFAPAPVNTPSPAPQVAPEGERSFRQSEVNEMIGRAKSEAIERFKRETSQASHANQSNQPQYTPPAQQQTYVPQQQTHAVVPEDQMRRLAAEEIQRSRTEWQQESQNKAQEDDAKRIASEFFTKIESGEGGRPAFEKALSESGLDLRSIPFHVQLSNMVDNTRDVMLELVKNPTKIGTIQNLIDIDLRAGRNPVLALAEMKRLSQSIKDNAQGANYKSPNDPLHQMRPSNAGTDKNGPLEIADYKRRYKV